MKALINTYIGQSRPLIPVIRPTRLDKLLYDCGSTIYWSACQFLCIVYPAPICSGHSTLDVERWSTTPNSLSGSPRMHKRKTLYFCQYLISEFLSQIFMQNSPMYPAHVAPSPAQHFSEYRPSLHGRCYVYCCDLSPDCETMGGVPSCPDCETMLDVVLSPLPPWEVSFLPTL